MTLVITAPLVTNRIHANATRSLLCTVIWFQLIQQRDQTSSVDNADVHQRALRWQMRLRHESSQYFGALQCYQPND
jgi:hypothetical protein